MAKLAIAPPVDEMLKPVATVLAVLVSDDAVRVKIGAASGGAEYGGAEDGGAGEGAGATGADDGEVEVSGATGADDGEVEVSGATGTDDGEVEVSGATGADDGGGSKVVICFDGADARPLPRKFVALIVKV